MKIKSIGFSITNNNTAVSTKDLLDYLIQKSTHEIKRIDYNRQILLTEETNYYSGLVLTYKNQTKNCLSTIKNGQFSIKVEDILSDDKVVSFNFFCINKTSLKGLYMYHRGSCSLNNLFSSWQSFSSQLIRKKMTEELKKLPQPRDEIKVKAIQDKYEGRLSFSVIIDKAGLQTLLQSFNEIKSASFRFDSIDFKDSDMIGVEQFTRNTEVTFNISDNDKSKVQQIGDNLGKVFNNIAGISRGVIHAIDHGKNERVIDLINSPCFFGEYDFDTIASNVNGLNNANYVGNAIIGMIKEEMENGSQRKRFV